MTATNLPTDPQQLAELLGRVMYERDKASQGMGIRLVEIRPGYTRMEMTVQPEMVNHHGTCQGGFVFLLADAAFAFACNSHNQSAVATACTIDFLLPSYPGDKLMAEAVERSRSKRTGVYDIAVTNQEGRCIALFRGKSHGTNDPVISKVG
jgi:acyl-CoA thioesterase